MKESVERQDQQGRIKNASSLTESRDGSGGVTVVVACPVCKQTFTTAKHLERHMQAAHFGRDSPAESVPGVAQYAYDDASDDDSDADLPIASGVVIQDRQVRVVAGTSQLANDIPMQGIQHGTLSTSFDLFDLDPTDCIFQQDNNDNQRDDKKTNACDDGSTNSSSGESMLDTEEAESSDNEGEGKRRGTALIPHDGSLAANTSQREKSNNSDSLQQSIIINKEPLSSGEAAAAGHAERHRTSAEQSSKLDGSSVGQNLSSKSTRINTSRQDAVKNEAEGEVNETGDNESRNSRPSSQRLSQIPQRNKEDDDDTSFSDSSSDGENLSDTDWNQHFEFARLYLQKGPAYIPKGVVYNKIHRLGHWADTERRVLKHGKTELCSTKKQREKIHKLNSIGFLWHPAPPRATQAHKSPNGLALSRQFSGEGKPSPWDGCSASESDLNRRKNLNWEASFEKAKAYVERTGDNSIAVTAVEDGYCVGTWAKAQRRILRAAAKEGTDCKVTQIRIHKLNSIGFDWSPSRGQSPMLSHERRGSTSSIGSRGSNSSADRRKHLSFDDWLALARKYGEGTGSGWIPTKVVLDERNLGDWAQNIRVLIRKYQRENGTSNVERTEFDRLLSFGFLTEKNRLVELPWRIWYGFLQDFLNKHGKLFIPSDACFGGEPIGLWADMQRRLLCGGRKSDLLTEKGRNKIDQLDAVGFVWKADTDAASDVRSSCECSGTASDRSAATEEAGSASETSGVVDKAKYGESTIREPANIESARTGKSSNAQNANPNALVQNSLDKENVVSKDHEKGSSRVDSIHRGRSREREQFQWTAQGSKGKMTDAQEFERRLDIDRRIMKSAETDLMGSLDFVLAKAKCNEFMESLGMRISEQARRETEVGSDSQKSLWTDKPITWPEPETTYDKERSFVITDYAVDNAWPKLQDIPTELVTLEVERSEAGLSVQVARESTTLTRFFGNFKSLTEKDIDIAFVDPFNAFWNTKVNYKLERLMEDATKWCIHVYCDPVKLRAFLHHLRLWESSLLRNAPLSKDNDDWVPVYSFGLGREGDNAVSGSFDSAEDKGTAGQAPEETKRDYYNHFSQKYTETVKIEFKNSGINVRTAISSMWAIHKKNFGDTCSDGCKCVFQLPFLTSQVIPDYVRKQKDRREARRRLEKIGFVDNFANKFLKLLARQYRSESPSGILERLTGMWWRHTRERRFGLRCKDSCDCIQGWEDVFGCGDPTASSSGTKKNARAISVTKGSKAPADLIGPIPKKRPIGHANTAQQKNDAVSGLTIPKKRKVSSSVHNGTANNQDEVSHFRIQNRRNEGSELPRNQRQVSHSSSGRFLVSLRGINERQFSENARPPDHTDLRSREYEVEVPADRPLGYYFRDRIFSSGQTKCIVASVRPMSQVDRRIQPGTQVVSVVFEGQKTDVKSYKDLKKAYEAAKGKGDESVLNISFVNSDVCSRAAPLLPGRNLECFDKNWCAKGNWRGRLRDGWAGGAGEIRNQTRVHGKTQANRAKTHMKTQPHSEDDGGWEEISFAEKRISKAHAGKSLLKSKSTSGSMTRATKRVRFQMNAQEKRYYRIDAPTTEMIVHKSSPENVLTRSQSRKPPSNPFEQGIQELKIVFSSWSPERTVEYFNRAGTSGFSLEMLKKIRDLEVVENRTFKDNLLKLMINAAQCGREAVALHDWTHLDLCADRLDNVSFDTRSSVKGLSLEVFGTRTGSNNPRENLLTIPFEVHGDTVRFENGKSKSMTFNPKTTRERSFEFLVKLYGNTIGKASILLSTIYSSCAASDHDRFSVEVECSPPLLTAQIHFRARRLFDSDEELIGMKRNVGKQFMEKIIENFLKPVEKDSPTKLSPDCVGGEGVSLLQMGIYFESRSVVDSLISHGADASRGVDLVNTFLQKLEKGERVGGSSSDVRIKRRERLESIAQLLQTKIAVQAETANTERGLPRLPDDWLHHDLRQEDICPCTGGRVCRDKACNLFHVQPLWGTKFEEYYTQIPKDSRTLPKDFLDNMKEQSQPDLVDGEHWWATVGYKKESPRKKVVYAEASHSNRSKSGVSWFASREEAKDALAKAVILSHWAEQNGICPLIESTSPAFKSSSEPPDPANDGAFCKRKATSELEVAGNSAKLPRNDHTSHRNEGYHQQQRESPQERRNSFTQNRYCPEHESRAIQQDYRDAVKNPHQPLEARHSPPDARLSLHDADSFDWDWLVRRLHHPMSRLCNFFGKTENGCLRGAHCRYPHVEAPFGSWLLPYDSASPDTLRPELIVYESGKLNGKEWYTTGYRCPRTNVFYFPEQQGGVRRPTGVWWYRTREEARRALAAVVTTAVQYRSK